MIARLTGTLAAKSLDTIILDVGGVGYELFVPLSVMESLANLGDRATLAVHTLVREDAITLYGFSTSADRLLFQRLMTVSGVGPKLALQALSVYTGVELQTALVTSDERSLIWAVARPRRLWVHRASCRTLCWGCWIWASRGSRLMTQPSS